jgi:cysteine synthase
MADSECCWGTLVSQVTGVSQYIKGSAEHGCPPLKPTLRTVAVEPMEQMLITAARGGEKIGPQGPHKIQGYEVFERL